jgi:hypothetical protein
LERKVKGARIPPVLPKLTIQADPTLRSLCPTKFIRYQQTIQAPELKAPMQTRHIPAYWIENVVGAARRMARPEISNDCPSKIYGRRILVRSEKYAMTMLKHKAAANGGTECS